tara:strand:+ start:1895 stop:2677 length:783 start_codon:yes stop_codon:yes gene_type:complete
MYIGNIPAENYASFLTQTFSVTATASYTLDHAVSNENDIRLVINNVVQQPGSGKAYTASDTTLTLSEATASTDVMYCVYLGRALQTVNPPNASVGTSQLVDGAVSSSKLSSGKVLQVVSVVDDTDVTVNNQTYTDTGLTANITPISTSSKVLVMVIHAVLISSGAGSTFGGIKLLRGSTDIFNPNSSNSTGPFAIGNNLYSSNYLFSPMQFLDSPNSTAQQSYKTQCRDYNTTGASYIRINYPGSSVTGKSVMTLMEVSA